MYNPYLRNPSPLIRVNGEEGARLYTVAPNETVPLFDGNEDIFYIKTADAAGFATIRKFRFEEIIETPMQAENFITKKEFEELKGDINDVKQFIQSLGKSTGKSANKSAD